MNTNLHPASLQLEKHMRADSLNDKISHRPPPEKLLQEGVLHDDPRSPEEKYAEAIEDEYAKREGGAWERVCVRACDDKVQYWWGGLTELAMICSSGVCKVSIGMDSFK